MAAVQTQGKVAGDMATPSSTGFAIAQSRWGRRAAKQGRSRAAAGLPASAVVPKTVHGYGGQPSYYASLDRFALTPVAVPNMAGCDCGCDDVETQGAVVGRGYIFNSMGESK